MALDLLDCGWALVRSMSSDRTGSRDDEWERDLSIKSALTCMTYLTLSTSSFSRNRPVPFVSNIRHNNSVQLIFDSYKFALR